MHRNQLDFFPKETIFIYVQPVPVRLQTFFFLIDLYACISFLFVYRSMSLANAQNHIITTVKIQNNSITLKKIPLCFCFGSTSMPISSPQQPLIYSTSLQFCLFQKVINELYSIQSFMSGSFHLAQCIWDFFFLCVSIVCIHSFSLMSTFLRQECIITW